MKTENARRLSANWAVAASILAGVQVAVAGPLWDQDLIIDAGSLPGAAQGVPNGTRVIRGKLGEKLLIGPIDTEDMYVFTIFQPTIFCARTVPFGELQDCCNHQLFPLMVTQGTDFNTQLFLFNSAGLGLLANDDESLISTLSLMGNAATDPGPPFVIMAPGTYYLAVSGGASPGGGNDPFSAGGPIFDQASVTEVSRPDGPGGGQIILGWSGGGETGLYEIVLCGTELIDGVPAMSNWALAVLAATMLAIGMVMIRRRLVVV